MTAIQRIRPQGLVTSPAFSHVAVVPPGATTIYVGGQNAVDAEGMLIGEGDVAAQSARALENAKTALAAASATLGDVVHWTVLFVDGADLAAGVRGDRRGTRVGCPSPGVGCAGRRIGCARRAGRDQRGGRSTAITTGTWVAGSAGAFCRTTNRRLRSTAS